ncbi:HAD-like domain-containing protein [Mycena alexandri]|uniref:HAD-like domain-containing protein n=1 Tax=Mycena alexandri TaxID=1745969 RepID=A0AAD6XAZ0_9AGAR|nr:HAD-like domain-containing protein [Mycena alexandri]
MAHLKAVIFDIGGVVMRSPFIAIAAYENKLELPENYLNCSIVERGSNGAWQQFERGELPLLAFYDAFSRDLSDTTNGNVWYAAYCKRKGIECPKLPQQLKVDGRELFGSMMRESAIFDPHILRAIRRIRAAGKHKIIALTNNFARTSTENPIPASELAFLGWDREGATPRSLRGLFDDFCDSSELGSRKPELRFYQMALDRNGLRPQETIFLDDIGINLKAARELGMETIHVPIGGTLAAAKKLEAKLGLDLTSHPREEEVMAKL